jgi:hypothetical protein
MKTGPESRALQSVQNLINRWIHCK